MPTKLIGTAPYQVPRNADLGTAAFQDANNVVINGGAIALAASNTSGYFQDTSISDVKPSLLLDFANSKVMDPRITFTRASVGSLYDGKTTAKSEENLLTYSQDFARSIWTKESLTIISDGSLAPNGSSPASLVVEGTANSDHRVYQAGTYSSGSSAYYTFSVYAKMYGRRYLLLRLANASYYYTAVFDLQAGTYSSATEVGYTGSTYSITSVGNGWYRCSITIYGNLTNQVIALSNTSVAAGNIIYAGDGVSGAYLWGAQLEQRSTVCNYVATTSYAITNYISALQTAAAGVPRFDHDPVTGESLGLLIEEGRTNLCPYSRQISSLPLTSVTAQNNVAVAPDGTLSATKLIQAAGTPTYNAVDLTNSTYPFSANQVVTTSIYAKAAEARYLRMSLPYTSGGYLGVQFDLLTGTISKTETVNATISSTSITSVGNGWYRCVVTGTLTTNSGYGAVVTPMIVPWTGGYSNIGSYGDGYSGIYVWGAQVEAASSASSYIPTSGAQATRATDYVYNTGTSFSSWYRQDSGTFYAETMKTSSLVAGYVWAVNLGNTVGNNDQLGLYYSASSTLQPYGYAQASVQYQFPSASYTPGTITKTALAYSTNDSAASYGGSSVSTDTVCVMPQCNYLFIGQQFGGNTILNGWVRKLAYYPARLSNAELQEMTL